jgi:hypothetical protein
MQTTVRCLTLERSRISFVKFILEAYDNVAVLSTLDAHAGIVRIAIAPGCETLVDGILRDLAERAIAMHPWPAADV